MQSQYQVLATRKQRTQTYKNQPKEKFHTNYFNISLDPSKSVIYQFDFKLGEEVPQDSLHYHRAIKHLHATLLKEVGYLCHKGQMLWGTKPLKSAIEIPCKF